MSVSNIPQSIRDLPPYLRVPMPEDFAHLPQAWQHRYPEADHVEMTKAVDRALWYHWFNRSTEFSSFARIAVASLLDIPGGFISANLVPNEVADGIEQTSDASFLSDIRAVHPLTRPELMTANHDGGSCLFVTSLFWNRLSPRGDVWWVEAMISYLVKWFEGNNIASICLPLRRDTLHIFDPLFASMDSSMYRETELDKDISLFRITGPYRPRGLAIPWIGRLLHKHLATNVELSNRDKLVGRIFYEHDFDVWEAIQRGGLKWSVPEVEHRPFRDPTWRSSSANQWRTRVGDLLGVNPNGSKGVDTMKLIHHEFKRNPRILAL